MNKTIKSIAAAVMCAVLLLSSAVSAFAAGSSPAEVKSCSSNMGYDFKLTFDSEYSDWIANITGVSVDGEDYAKGSSSYSVWNNKQYYADSSNMYLLIGEGFANDTAQCTIKSNGYGDLVLQLDKTTYTASVISSGGGAECVHTGGNATCKSRAVCELCGEEYGELGDHSFDSNYVCTVCSYSPSDAPEITLDNSSSTYLILQSAADYVGGVSDIKVNGESWAKNDYKIALNGKQYYLGGDGAIYFDKMYNTLKSGDIITINNPDYKPVNLKLYILGDEISIKPVSADEKQGDNYTLYVRLSGYFESAIVNQDGYDAISSATTSVSQNKNSNAFVEAALLPDNRQPSEEDWKALADSGITVDVSKTAVNLDSASGMAGHYSVYDSSVTLAGVPTQAGRYSVSVTVTDSQGRSATSNELPFVVYSGEENLEDLLTYANCKQTSDGKYMYDMDMWAVKNFDSDDNTVTVLPDIKAWYGSHTSGTYGELGYAVPQGSAPVQTLIVPSGCNLTLVNMDILSSVKIVVADGGRLVLRDSVIQGVVEINSGGRISVNYDDYSGKFLTGSSINGQLILNSGAVIENSAIYSNTNYIANGTEARKNISPIVVAKGNVTVEGQVFVRGDEAPTGTDPDTGKSYAGQTAFAVQNGNVNITDGSLLALYGGGKDALTSVGGKALVLDNGTVSGCGKLIAVGGDGTFDDGGSAVSGKGEISAAYVYLEGGNSLYSKESSQPGKAIDGSVTLSAQTNRSTVDGLMIKSESEIPTVETYWRDITSTPDLSLYKVEHNAPADKKNTDENNGGSQNDNKKADAAANVNTLVPVTTSSDGTTSKSSVKKTSAKKPKSTSIKKVTKGKKKITVQWKKVSGVKGYQVQVATDKKFKKNKKTVNIKKQKTTKTTVKKLNPKKKYYVRVRTYKIVNGKKVYSSWSKVKTIKTK